MSQTDEIAYVPLLFGYSNYARPGFRPRIVRFGDVPRSGQDVPLGAILGGAGLAVSTRCIHPEVATDYAAFVASGDVQRTLYFASGGQPGHGTAWRDPQVNAAASDFFRDTIETLRHSYLRPRYDGYLAVQDTAGDLVHAWLIDGGPPDPLLAALDDLYRRSRVS
jgi:multiple sugar transport system substrate-binding protein